MLFAAISSGDAEGLAAVGTLALAVATVAGRSARNYSNDRKEKRQSEHAFRVTVMGKAEDKDGPAIDGLVQQMEKTTHVLNGLIGRVEALERAKP